MADRVEHFVITEAAGGSPGTFTLSRVTFDPGIVTAIIIHMPAGHAGNTGIQIAYSQQQIIPSPPRTYYRGNKRTIRHELSELFPAQGDWWIQTFNAGRYDHTFHVDFEVDALVGGAARLPPVLLLYGGFDTGSVAPEPAPVPVGAGGGPAPV